ncbi:MAG: leucyl aminopeptidase family protein, partial [Candidatus Limnocylindrales bacterium]
SQPWDVQTELLVVPVPAGEPTDEAFVELDRRLGGALAAYRRMGELTGKPYETALIRRPDRPVDQGVAAEWVLALGSGEPDALDRQAVLRLGAAVLRRLAGRQLARMAVWLRQGLSGGPDMAPTDVAQLLTRGLVEGSYDPAVIYRGAGDETPPRIDEVVLVAPEFDAAPLRAAAERGVIIGEGTNRARTLSQRASNDVSPEVLADEATAIAKEAGLAIEILDPKQAAKLGMGLFLAVGRGSDNPPRFITMRAGAEGQTDARGRLLALIGKGVTFDSGGISIKPADRMDEMKMDKTGACTVIVAIATAHRLAPDVPLLAVAPAVENMPGSHATRPGDVVRAMNGKVVEITNTDAEGRLILGDALTWAERHGATHTVDVATLTGAVERAFGKLMTGGFGTPQDWWDEVAAAGAHQGEKLWQIPLVDDYRRDMDSWYADIQNSGSADGSLVKSGLFLREFATRPWVHLDIGGTGYLRRPTPWAARGATGVTHATLVELALRGA